MTFGLTFEKLLLIAVIAVFILGPERLPHYAEQLARLVKSVRLVINGAKERLQDEMGPEYDDIDWKKLDPRQYDPRRIIKQALMEDAEPMIRPPSISLSEPLRGKTTSQPEKAANPTPRIDPPAL